MCAYSTKGMQTSYRCIHTCTNTTYMHHMCTHATHTLSLPSYRRPSGSLPACSLLEDWPSSWGDHISEVSNGLLWVGNLHLVLWKVPRVATGALSNSVCKNICFMRFFKTVVLFIGHDDQSCSVSTSSSVRKGGFMRPDDLLMRNLRPLEWLLWVRGSEFAQVCLFHGLAHSPINNSGDRSPVSTRWWTVPSPTITALWLWEN